MNADVCAKLEALELGSLSEAADYMAYRAATKREQAEVNGRNGHESYADDMRRDAALLELAVLSLGSITQMETALHELAVWDRRPWSDMADSPWEQLRDVRHALHMACARAAEALKIKPDEAPGMTEENRYFGKDCPKGKVQVEFVALSPALRLSEYGWKPSESAFLEVWVDGQRFRIDVGNIERPDGTLKRGLHINAFAKMDQIASNAFDLWLED